MGHPFHFAIPIGPPNGSTKAARRILWANVVCVIIPIATTPAGRLISSGRSYRRGKAALSADSDDLFAFIAGLIPLVVATGAGAMGNRTIGTITVRVILVGTIIGVLVIPGLYYLFAKLSGDRKLLRTEMDRRSLAFPERAERLILAPVSEAIKLAKLFFVEVGVGCTEKEVGEATVPKIIRSVESQF